MLPGHQRLLYSKGFHQSLNRIGIFLCWNERILWFSSGLSQDNPNENFAQYVSLNLPEADLILLSLDGDKEKHNQIRGDTYDQIMKNIEEAPTNNICLYTAINQINKGTIQDVCKTAMNMQNIRAVSFNFHTPYPDTKDLALSREEKKMCCDIIEEMMDAGAPVFNLRSAFPNLINNNFPTPCHQCVVMENGKISVCGRCIDVPGLCEQCGYFFVAEYTLIFKGRPRVILDMLRTYLKYI